MKFFTDISPNNTVAFVSINYQYLHMSNRKDIMPWFAKIQRNNGSTFEVHLLGCSTVFDVIDWEVDSELLGCSDSKETLDVVQDDDGAKEIFGCWER